MSEEALFNCYQTLQNLLKSIDQTEQSTLYSAVNSAYSAAKTAYVAKVNGGT